VPTISLIIPEVLDVIISELETRHLPFPDKEIWAESAKEYERLWNYPGAVASIDGKHCQVVVCFPSYLIDICFFKYCLLQAPPNSGSTNFSYKGTYSIVLMALVDANYKFLVVDVGGQGRMSDAGLFNRSSLNQLIEAGQLNLPPDLKLPGLAERDSRVPHVILADEGK